MSVKRFLDSLKRGYLTMADEEMEKHYQCELAGELDYMKRCIKGLYPKKRRLYLESLHPYMRESLLVGYALAIDVTLRILSSGGE